MVAAESDVSEDTPAVEDGVFSPAAEDGNEEPVTESAPPSPSYSEEETRLRAMAAAWDAASASSRSSMTAEISQFASAPADAASLKAQLMGSWKLMFTADADSVATSGLSGFAGEKHTFVEGHFQKFTKPDPMDILNGVKDKFHLETFEVISDVFKGKTTLAALKGGYYVGELATLPLGVLETYSRRELDGTSTGDADIRNRWTCTYVSETIRVCKADDDGSYRVYDKLDDAALNDGIAALRAKEVPIDEEMLQAWQDEQARKAEELKAKQQELDPEDDPNDTRPMWQKRIDKADGIKRTANGTPIINHGPIGGGPTGPPVQK